MNTLTLIFNQHPVCIQVELNPGQLVRERDLIRSISSKAVIFIKRQRFKI